MHEEPDRGQGRKLICRPIFGGKVVIQAKRYKSTVGVSAVRDLFGTVHNEGAAKGILVTTSGYGKASYQFAEGKPLELLDGTNLLGAGLLGAGLLAGCSGAPPTPQATATAYLAAWARQDWAAMEREATRRH